MAQSATSQANGSSALPVISGYLEKKAKTGKWQKRWFETNAHFLTYYKTKKMEKLLAALNLPQVGAINLVDEDEMEPENNGALFTLELNSTRIYTMRAATRDEAARWVEVLKILQSLDVEDVRPTGVMDESPSAVMMSDSGGASSTKWDKSSSSALCGACTSCFGR